MDGHNEMNDKLFDLTGRTALVTGASSGLGAHFSRVLSSAGARVVLAARRAERLNDLAAEIREAGGHATALTLDVTDTGSVDEAMAVLKEAGGELDVLINNAGIAQPQRLLDTSEATWQRTIDVNLTGVFRVGRAAARLMAASGRGGAIVNIASVLGLVVQPTQAAYAASKAAVLHLTRAMALELRKERIRVNAIAPGYFETEINSDFFATERGQRP